MQNYINALLSDISYIKFDSKYVLNSENATPRGISAAEIDFFNNNFTILNQDGNSWSGFSATTFKATKDIYFDGVLQYRQGELFVANRGTEPTFTDLVLTDALNLADSKIIGYLTGIPVSQLDYLFTETMITSTLDTIISKAFGGLYGFDQTSNADAYLKQMYEKYSVQDVGPTINVTGHSLGGNLAFTSAVNNPSIVKSSYTYNAAGVDFQTYVILKVQSFIANNFPESLTAIESITNHFKNIKALMQNSFGFYNDVGIQFTTADFILRHPEKRIAMVTEDMRNRKDDGFMANHSVKYLREISLVYEIIGTLLHNKSYDKYPEISEIINSYKIESYASQYGKDGNTLINFLLKNITDYMGINITPKSENGLSILEALSGTTATIKNYKSISATTTDNAKNRANIYALLNLVPFVIESGNNNFTADIYNGNNYSQEFLDTRKDFMDKLIEFGNRGNKYIVLAEYIEIIFPTVQYRDISVAYINSSTGKGSYLDLLNKTLVLENMTREEFFTDFNISTTVFLTKNTLSYILNNKNSKVFDSFGNDSIQILNANAEIFLTSGNDTITIDMLKGGSLKKLEIKDGGLGDKIIFNATNDSDIFEGTIYNDIIIGNNQNDNLNGSDGDDTIYGDIDSHNINNYTGPLYIGNDTIDGGDGNDTIYGGTGSDVLNGGNGNDTIYGSYSDSNLAIDNILSDKNYTNNINGGEGIDVIYGGEGRDIINNVGMNDMSYINLTNEQFNILKNKSTTDILFGDRITGGKGDDEIYGTQYGDHYYYNSGDGNDNIYERKSGVGVNEFIDKIYIKSNFSNFSFSHNNTGNLTMTDKTTNQSVVFHDFMNLKYVEEFIFMTGNTENGYTYNYILDLVLNRTAQNIGGVGILNGNDLMDLSHTERLNGISNISNNINGGYGRDIITGGNLKDIINRSSSNSILDSSKNYGDDITGGKGDDEIYGTNYGDTYNYRLGDGFDTIYETTAGDPTSENFIDRIVFNASILATYISFKQFNSNVIVLYNNIEILQLVDFMRYKGIEQMCFSDGRFWDKYEILARIPKIDPEDPTKITGTAFDDILDGTDGDDTIHGGEGNDTINGGKGDDKLYGDNGNDTINGGLGNDEIYGGLGNDTLNGNEGDDTIYGNEGNDTINGNAGSDIIYADDGDDIITNLNVAVNEIDTIYAGNGADKIVIKNGNAIVHGDDGDDIITSYGSNVEIYGDNGNDSMTLNYASGNAYTGAGSVFGGEGNDTITISNTNNNTSSYTIVGGKGNDTINLSMGKHNIIYNNDDGKDTITTYSNALTQDIKVTFNGISRNSIDINSLQLDDSGTTLIVKFDDNNSITLKNYFIAKTYLNSISSFNFGSDLMSNIELKNIATNIVKAEDDGYFYDTVWSDKITGTNGNDKIIISKGSDDLTNIDLRDTLSAGAGIDTITIRNGNAIVHGDDGDDIITSYGSNVEIYGDNGNDSMTLNYASGNAYTGSGSVFGGEGNDTITISNTNNNTSSYIIEGGKGNDTINLSMGKHNIIYNNDDGKDTITTYSNALIQDIKVTFNGISRNSIDINSLQLDDSGTTLIIKFDDNNSITLKNYFIAKTYLNSISSFNFGSDLMSNIELKNIATNIVKAEDDGYFYDTVWSDKITGTNGNDKIIISKGSDDLTNIDLRDTLSAGAGIDTITIRNGNAIVHGDDGDDIITSYGSNVEIYGDNGNDSMTLNYASGNAYTGAGSVFGGEGNDTITISNTNNNTSSYTIVGGKGNDTINLSMGKHNIIYNNDDGKDTITTYSNALTQDIKVTFNGISRNSIDINSLQLDDSGTTLIIKFDDNNSITLKNYFIAKTYLNSISSFNFGSDLMSNIELKNIATNIVKAEDDGYFYDTVWSDKITGTNGNDKIIISKGSDDLTNIDLRDTLSAGAGIDTITIKNGNAIVHGDDGDDIITSYGANVEIYGDNGNDSMILNYASGNAYTGSGSVFGGEGNDTITISNTNNNTSSYIIEGGKGNDTINLSMGKHNIIYNNDDGKDTISTFTTAVIQDIKLFLNVSFSNIEDIVQLDNNGRDVVFKFNDANSVNLKNYFADKTSLNSISAFYFNGMSLSNIELKNIATNIKGTVNDDIIYDTIWEDKINLIGGNDIVYLRNGNDKLTTSNNASTIYTTSMNNILNSNSGNDIFSFTNRTNTLNLIGNSGHDVLQFGYTPTTSLLNVNIGTDFNNIFITDMSNGFIKLGWGNNSLKINQSDFNMMSLSLTNYTTNNILDFKHKISGDNNDNILKALSNDNTTIYGNGGDDNITGGSGNDILYGGDGNDSISGGLGSNILYGGNGNDYLIGNAGNFDTLYGESGNDSYYLGNTSNAVDSYGLNEIRIGANLRDKTLILTASGNSINFRTTDNTYNANFTGSVNRIDKTHGISNYSLIGTEINRLFELQAALQTETDYDKIKSINQSINQLWNYDQP